MRHCLAAASAVAARTVPAQLPPSFNTALNTHPFEAAARCTGLLACWLYIWNKQKRQQWEPLSNLAPGKSPAGAGRQLAKRSRRRSPAMPPPAAAWEAVSAASSSAVRPQGSSGVGWRARESGRLGGGSAVGVPPAAAAAAAVKAVQAGWSRSVASKWAPGAAASCWAAVEARIWQGCWLGRWPCQAECIGRWCEPCRCSRAADEPHWIRQRHRAGQPGAWGEAGFAPASTVPGMNSYPPINRSKRHRRTGREYQMGHGGRRRRSRTRQASLGAHTIARHYKEASNLKRLCMPDDV